MRHLIFPANADTIAHLAQCTRKFYQHGIAMFSYEKRSPDGMEKGVAGPP
jgi:hypothetical protein